VPADRGVQSFQSTAPVLPRTQSAALVWVAAVASTLMVGVLLSAAAVARWGSTPGAAQKLMSAEESPLVSDPTWIVAGTVASELAVAGVLTVAWSLWRRRLSRLPTGLTAGASLGVFLPFRRPSGLAVAGAVLLALGSAPLAEAVAIVMGKLFATEVTAGKIVVVVARGSGSTEFVFALF